MADPKNNKGGFRSEALLGFGVMAMIFVLIVPLPSMALDVMIAMNIAFATLILLITLSARESLELGIYPTLLLLTTLFRLSLNVASTRLILLEGQAGDVIQAFGDFVVGGDLVVGVVIFAILVIIQFVVITKGSNRIGEVAARFTLDAMPGKQMAIDADLNSGIITEDEAKTRREKISQEAEFYGSMDGAGKFVRGDAVAGLIITFINVIGGVVIGMTQNMTATEALQKYSILTIGDGLVSQTPALIIAIAAGILVTKSSSKEKMATEFGMQLFANSRALGIGAAVVSIMSFVPGFPKLPFLTIGALLFFAHRRRRKAEAEEERLEEAGELPAAEAEDEGPELTPEALGRLLHVDRMGIEIGYRLIQIVDAHKKGGLLDHISMIRKQFAKETGIVVPPIRLRDNLTLDANEYRIMISGQEVARGVLYPNHFLAMNPGNVTEEISGVRGEDPTFGMPAIWVREEQKNEAEMLGYTVVDAISVMVTHLTETIRGHAAELLTREDVQALLDRVREHSPTVVGELHPEVLGLGEIQGVLQNLLSERVPIRNMPAILETLADQGKKLKDPDQLTEFVRQRLSRLLCELHGDRDGKLAVIVLDPQLESALEAELGGQTSGSLSATALQRLQERAVAAYGDSVRGGHDPVILTRAGVRRYLAEVLAGIKPRIPVLSYNEVAMAKSVVPVGQISITQKDEKKTPLAAGV